jgi:hypothetical protein
MSNRGVHSLPASLCTRPNRIIISTMGRLMRTRLLMLGYLLPLSVAITPGVLLAQRTHLAPCRTSAGRIDDCPFTSDIVRDARREAARARMESRATTNAIAAEARRIAAQERAERRELDRPMRLGPVDRPIRIRPFADRPIRIHPDIDRPIRLRSEFDRPIRVRPLVDAADRASRAAERAAARAERVRMRANWNRW